MMSDEERGSFIQSDEKAEASLPDAAVVVRGGLSTPDTLHKAALAHHDEYGDFAISVRSLPGMTADDLARIEPPLAHPSLRETTVGALRGAGYDVIPDEPPPAHALIVFPRLPVDKDYVTVSAIFRGPRENPAYRKEQDDQ